MRIIREKKQLVLELSKDFYIEAETDNEQKCYDFWLCRKGYGVKVYMHGLPFEYHTCLRQALRFVGEIADAEYVAPYLEDLLEGEEVDENLNILD